MYETTAEKTSASYGNAFIWARAAVMGAVAAGSAATLWFGSEALFAERGSVAAIAVGPAAGFALYHGSGRRGSVLLQAAGVTITLAAILVTEYFLFRRLVLIELAKEGYGSLPLFLPSEFQRGFVSSHMLSNPGSLLFFGFSLAYAIALTRRRVDE